MKNSSRATAAKFGPIEQIRSIAIFRPQKSPAALTRPSKPCRFVGFGVSKVAPESLALTMAPHAGLGLRFGDVRPTITHALNAQAPQCTSSSCTATDHHM